MAEVSKLRSARYLGPGSLIRDEWKDDKCIFSIYTMKINWLSFFYETSLLFQLNHSRINFTVLDSIINKTANMNFDPALLIIYSFTRTNYFWWSTADHGLWVTSGLLLQKKFAAMERFKNNTEVITVSLTLIQIPQVKLFLLFSTYFEFKLYKFGRNSRDREFKNSPGIPFTPNLYFEFQ